MSCRICQPGVALAGEVAGEEDILDHDDDAGEEGVSCTSHDASWLTRVGTEIPVSHTEPVGSGMSTVDLLCRDRDPDHGDTRRTFGSSVVAGRRLHL